MLNGQVESRFTVLVFTEQGLDYATELRRVKHALAAIKTDLTDLTRFNRPADLLVKEL